MTSCSSCSFHGSSGPFTNPLASPNSSSYTFHGSSRPFSHYPRRPSQQDTRCSKSLLLAVPFFFALLASLVLIWGIYGNQDLEMGRNYSRLLSANSVFVKKIVVVSRIALKGPILYGFSKTPPLDREKDWSEDHKILIPGNHHHEWALWLNKGSKVTLELDVLPRNKDLLVAVIQGKDHFDEWLRDATDTSIMSSYMTVRGKGVLHFKVKKNEDYFFALGNLRSLDAQVRLRLVVFEKIFNTKSAVSKCYLARNTCCFELPFLGSNIALIVTPDRQDEVDVWPVKVIYKTRWVTYFSVYGMIMLVELVIILRFNHRQRHQHVSQAFSESAPLVSFPEAVTPASFEDLGSDHEADWQTDPKVGDNGYGTGNIRVDENLCVICFDARKDCFFDPCGHCATCYQCGLRVKAQKNHLCPICRQNIRSIRKIFVA